jgi:hypothetical protein
MVAFEGETYLRLLGERLLSDRDPQRHHRSPLELPAAALVVAGAIGRDRAQRVIDDHTAAVRVRSGDRGFPHFGARATRRTTGRLAPRQMMILNHELAFADGLLFLRDLAIAPDGATLRFRWRSDVPHGRGHSRMMIGGGGAHPWGSAAPPVIVDDAGNRPTVTSGSGGGSDSQWDGRLDLAGPLSPATQWLEVEGTRIALDRRVAASRSWIEPLPEEAPVARYLRRRLAVAEMPFGHPVELEAALDALRAAGALAGEDRLVAELEEVAARLPGRHGHWRGGVTPTGRRVPEPWRSLLARLGRDDGPAFTLVLGAITPRWDGIQAAFASVTSDATGFEAEFEVAPNVLQGDALGELPVAWSARDDRGNRYLGAANGWGGGEDSASGTMRFWPALDPRATRLELVISAQRHRAVLAIELGDAA